MEHLKAAEYAIGEISGWFARERKYMENKYTPEERKLHRSKDIRPGFDHLQGLGGNPTKECVEQGCNRQGITLCSKPTAPHGCVF
jgi:hypothetical protein